MAILYKAMLAIAALLALLPIATAFYISPIFSGFHGNCTQLNSTFVSCDDAVPVPVSYSVSARYAQYYGNFSVYSTNTNNVSEPLGLNGKPCSVPSSSTVTCMITLSAIPITAGNGIIDKTFTILLVSNNYPQVSFMDSFNVIIAHNLTGFEASLLKSFNYSYSSFVSMRMKYLYFCSTYGICPQGLGANFTSINSMLGNASASINDSTLNEAYSNLTAANYSMLHLEKPFSEFLNSSNIIANNILKARTLLATMQSDYAANSTALSRCALPNGTSYSKAINGSIARLASAESIATVGSSYLYLNETMAAKVNESTLISACTPLVHITGISLNLPSKYVLYGVAAVIVLLAFYSVSKFLSFRSVQSMRLDHGTVHTATKPSDTGNEGEAAETPTASNADEQKAAAAAGANAAEANQEERKPSPSSLEDEFDSWLGNVIGKQPKEKHAEKDKPE